MNSVAIKIQGAPFELTVMSIEEMDEDTLNLAIHSTVAMGNTCSDYVAFPIPAIKYFTRELGLSFDVRITSEYYAVTAFTNNGSSFKRVVLDDGRELVSFWDYDNVQFEQFDSSGETLGEGVCKAVLHWWMWNQSKAK